MLKLVPAYETLRRRAEQRLRAVPPATSPPTVHDLKSAFEELHVYGAELEIQNEELLESRAQIEASQKKYFRHFDLAPVGLLRLSREGLILEANILGAQMLDVNRVLLQTVPRPFLAHIAPVSLATYQQHLESASASGKMEMCELLLRGIAGRETFVRMQSVVSRGENETTDFYITLTDLTERREVEQKLAQQKLLADAAVTAKELLFAMLSHELRTPLTPLVALVKELAADPQRSSADHAAFAIIRRNLDLEIRLIDDLLDFTRVTSGKLELHRQTTDLHRCLENAVEICRNELVAKGLDLKLDFLSEAPLLFVHADENRLEQVFWNLLKNAIKFTPSNGQITIKTRCPAASRVVVEFHDTGIGIECWPLERIFEPFFQADAARKQNSRGLGLGLAICKAIIEAHGGTLAGASAGRDQGATFHLQLPTVVTRTVGAATEPAVRRDGLRLLLVEDSNDIRKVLGSQLDGCGYEVELARDPAEARALCAVKTFDFLISNIGLPGDTGYKVLKQLNAQYGLRGIAMSGFATDADITQSREAGFLEHLVKPIDARALDDAIQRLAASL